MREETKHVIQEVTNQVMTSPKTALATVFGVNFNAWYVEYGSPLLSFLTSIGGLVMIAVLVRYHLTNTKKIQMEIEKQVKENLAAIDAGKEQLKKESGEG